MCEDLQLKAVSAGMSSGQAADIVSTFGPDVLSLAVELLKNGFSVAWVVELVNKFGTDLSKFMTAAKPHLCEAAKKAIFEGEAVAAIGVGGASSPTVLAQLIQALMPILIQNFPQLLQILAQALAGQTTA